MVVAFIGLGNMGLPMAKNLVKAGFVVQGYNRSRERRDLLEGAKLFAKAEDAVKGADVVITMLSDDDAVREVQSAVMPAMKPGSIHLSMSTIAPATATELAEKCKTKGITYLSSPVMGRPPAAEAKQLFILLSGNASSRERVQPLLMAMGQRVFDFGEEVSAANTVKLAMNYMIFTTIGMLSEVMLVAEKTGIDKQALFNTMTSTIFGSPVINVYGSLILQEKDNPNGFATRLASKDLRLMQETAAGRKLQLPLGEVIQQHFREIISNNEGNKDVSLLIAHLRSSLG
jgi:3-hydroxyisobutyrate dehydrogenase-like beta-hydroxyacid dehydrogenase